MEKEVVNWGVISCASIADSAVIPGIKQASNARLYAISSRSREKLEEFEKKHNPVKAYASYEELLDDPEIDAVYIPLPNGLHYEWVLKAAEKKKHILCEKPLGVKVEEVETMREVCAKNGVLLMEAFAYRHSPLTHKVKSLIEEGVIGRIRLIESHFSFSLTDLDNVRLSGPLKGGATYDIGCYNINIIRYLVGSEPISILANGEVSRDSGVDLSSCILMEFEGGVRAFSYCAFEGLDRSGYRVVGEKGILEVPARFNCKGTASIFIKKAEETKELEVECPDNYMLEVEQFGRCLKEGENPLVSIKDSYGNAMVIDKALEQILKRQYQE